MDEELRKTDPEMPDSAEELDLDLAELPDELLEGVACGDEIEMHVLHKSRCPKCGHTRLKQYWVDGKASYVICPNCNFRHNYYW